jgi:hypothetical protein
MSQLHVPRPPKALAVTLKLPGQIFSPQGLKGERPDPHCRPNSGAPDNSHYRKTDTNPSLFWLIDQYKKPTIVEIANKTRTGHLSSGPSHFREGTCLCPRSGWRKSAAVS